MGAVTAAEELGWLRPWESRWGITASFALPFFTPRKAAGPWHLPRTHKLSALEMLENSLYSPLLGR